MSDPSGDGPVFRLDCPCCGANLVVDAMRGVVLESSEPGNARKGADLKDAGLILKEESSRIHDRYRQIVEAEKGRGATMEKRFKDFLEKAKDEPPPRPVRDIDLD